MAYARCREWDMQPSEFWALSPWEFWLEFDARYAAAIAMKKAVEGTDKFSGPEWEKARAIHRKKMEAKT